jgi:site-specific DNA-methyltransferase (adenine-specific)
MISGASKSVSIGPFTLICGDCFTVLPNLGVRVDAIITDPPFSERTHSGHDNTMRKIKVDANGKKRAKINSLGYACWSDDQVKSFVPLIDSVCGGWLVVMTDHYLALKYFRAMERTGRTAFPPLPFYDQGRSCRFAGDGPSSWTDWIIVSRTKAQLRWGSLSGGYVKKKWMGSRASKLMMGAKPPGLMKMLVKDYSRENDLVCDSCMGSGTTGVACIEMKRRFIGIEKDPERFELAKDRIIKAYESKKAELF